MRLSLVAFPAMALTVAAALESGEASAQPPRLRPALQGVRFGSSVDEVQAALRRRIQQRYEKLLHAAEDPIARRELEHKLQREVDALIVGVTKLDGQRTGLEVGIAGEEFKHGTGESVLRVREAGIDRFYFFIGGKLWKVFGAYLGDVVKETAFVPFLAKQRRRFGRPVKLHRVSRDGQRVIVAAEWQEKGIHLEVRDRSEFFQSYTESFTDPAVRARIDDLRGNPAAKKGDATDALIELATGGGSTPDAPPPDAKKDAAPDGGKPAEENGAEAGGEPRNKNEKPAQNGPRRRRVVDIY